MNEITNENGAVSKDERMWGMLCHLTVFSGFIIPFGHILAPLVIWLIKKDEMPFVDDQGKESLNFQITMTIGFILCVILMLVFIGVILVWLLIIFDIVVLIIASIKANDGVHYRYPWAIRLLK